MRVSRCATRRGNWSAPGLSRRCYWASGTIRSKTTPLHVPAKVIQVSDIPRTKSGKIVELAVRQVVHGEGVRNTESLANPEALMLYRGLAELAN